MNIGEEFYCPHCMKQISYEEEKCPHCNYDLSQTQSVSFLEEGTLLQNGRYQLGVAIGSGGFGITYAAWDIALGHPVAIKEYYPQGLCERDSSEDDSVIINPGREGMYQAGLFRFIREARILGTLQNVKNVVPVLEWFEANNTAYIVMKYISGVTLDEYVRINNIPPQKLIESMRDLIDSLVLIHEQGILHRDISPSNIMVQEDGTMTLIDFGAASAEERRKQGGDKTVIYNRRYAPIEQYDENGMQGPFTDVYALSATIYHLVCGQPPKESVARKAGESLKSPLDMNIPVKKYQNKAIMNGLILQPEKRTQTMTLFRSMLYNLPLPEEVARRRRFMFCVISAAAVISASIVLAVLNFTSGFPLGGGLWYSIRSVGLHVSGSSGGMSDVSVPSSAAGVDVVQIDDAAFQGQGSLRRAEIPGTVRTVGRFAFNGCASLDSVVIGEGTERILSQAFANCPSLQAVSVPSTLREIDPEAFLGHSTRLVLLGAMDSPAREIAESLGINYAHIETVSNDSGVTVTKYETGQNSASVPDSLHGLPVTVLESGTMEAVFPSSVQSVILPHSLGRLGDNALKAVSIKGIELPDSLREIGREAFSQSFIESVKIPSGVVSAGAEAFSVCLYLRSADISQAMTEIPEKFFERCNSLSSVAIPEGIERVGQYAFRRCYSLSHINMPESMRLIEFSAFEDCTSLAGIYLPPSIASMPVSALNGCPNSLTVTGYKGSFAEYFCNKYGFDFFSFDSADRHIVVTPRGGMWVEAGISSSDTIFLPSYSVYSKAVPATIIYRVGALRSRNVILPGHIHEIGAGSFRGNPVIESINCPASLRRIGGAAFEGCGNLSAVNLREGLEEIGIQAFSRCGKLSEIELPPTVKTIGESAFDGCASLVSVRIPQSMTLLDRRTFAGTGLVALNIPQNIAKCRQAFEDCKSLKSVVFEQGVKTIWGTFAGCENLETVTIPDGVNQISRSTFAGCRNLRDIWIYSDNAELDYISDNTRRTAYLFADSPNLTIHAHRGSNPHMYADLHGINFSPIPASDDTGLEGRPMRYRVSGRIYTDEQLAAMISPVPNDGKYHYWGQFQYALGYGFTDLTEKCLEAYEAAGDENDKRLAAVTRLFLAQSKEHGYSGGIGVLFFENNAAHPSLKAGDIIVEVKGETFSTFDEFNWMLKAVRAESDTAPLTVLRADSSGVLRKTEAFSRKGEPLFAAMDVFPKTFEEL
ncbi:MAG: leucine-rich repeat protein [Synergistaceae bacterium]|nr:leucine-rich repeat protein [Synergistaceae bacterium]